MPKITINNGPSNNVQFYVRVLEGTLEEDKTKDEGKEGDESLVGNSSLTLPQKQVNTKQRKRQVRPQHVQTTENL